MKKIVYIIILILLLIGSHNYKELNNIAIITNISIEKNSDTYKVIFQEIIPKKENNTIAKDYKYYTNTKKDLKKAFLGIDEDITKEIYLEHLENIIIKDDSLIIIDELKNVLKSDLDNFNIILTESDPSKIIKYSNNYKYINTIIDDNVTLRSIKKAKLEKRNIKIPILKIENDKPYFYKYKILNGDNYA